MESFLFLYQRLQSLSCGTIFLSCRIIVAVITMFSHVLNKREPLEIAVDDPKVSTHTEYLVSDNRLVYWFISDIFHLVADILIKIVDACFTDMP